MLSVLLLSLLSLMDFSPSCINALLGSRVGAFRGKCENERGGPDNTALNTWLISHSSHATHHTSQITRHKSLTHASYSQLQTALHSSAAKDREIAHLKSLLLQVGHCVSSVPAPLSDDDDDNTTFNCIAKQLHTFLIFFGFFFAAQSPHSTSCLFLFRPGGR